MKKLILLSAAILSIAATSSAKTEEEVKTSNVSYSLPSTTLSFTVSARKEVFKAGPFAKYAKKYLGFSPRQSDETTYEISKVSLKALTEADLSARRKTVITEAHRPEFIQLSTQGLISCDLSSAEKSGSWRFPLMSKEKGFAGKSMPSNLSREDGTQNMYVAKTSEDKAKETADKIFQIRENRYKILVGDTDATYSGEAMKAAVDALEKMEKEYLALFTGKSSYSYEQSSFEVIPSPSDSLQQYVAFRVSESEGLVSANNFAGKPYYLNLTIDSKVKPEPAPQGKGHKAPKKPVNAIYYRIPAICTATLTDGVNTILQTRIPVYQLGVEESVSVNVK